MTICEKFKLMMASFADIRAAIVEKGGHCYWWICRLC